MIRAMADRWWTVVLRGLLAIVFGILAWSYPGLTLLLLMLFVGAFWVIEGLLKLFSVMGGERNKLWGFLYASITIVAGVYVITRPGISAIALSIVIGIWAIIKGVSEVAIAFRLRKVIEGEFLMILSGLIAILFGLFLAFRPGAGAIALIWIIALFAFVEGILLVGLGLKLRGVRDRLGGGSAAAA
jgi:uncharacterized membrane protein HdeD (DUF308 family)